MNKNESLNQLLLKTYLSVLTDLKKANDNLSNQAILDTLSTAEHHDLLAETAKRLSAQHKNKELYEYIQSAKCSDTVETISSCYIDFLLKLRDHRDSLLSMSLKNNSRTDLYNKLTNYYFP